MLSSPNSLIKLVCILNPLAQTLHHLSFVKIVYVYWSNMLVNLFVVHFLHELHLVIDIVWILTSYTVILHLRRWHELRDLLGSQNRKSIFESRLK